MQYITDLFCFLKTSLKLWHFVILTVLVFDHNILFIHVKCYEKICFMCLCCIFLGSNLDDLCIKIIIYKFYCNLKQKNWLFNFVISFKLVFTISCLIFISQTCLCEIPGLCNQQKTKVNRVTHIFFSSWFSRQWIEDMRLKWANLVKWQKLHTTSLILIILNATF